MDGSTQAGKPFRRLPGRTMSIASRLHALRRPLGWVIELAGLALLVVQAWRIA